MDCPIKSATFKRDTQGHWYVTLTAEFEMPEVPPGARALASPAGDRPLPPANPDKVVGVDLGLKDFAVLSDGTRIAPPRFYRKAERRLRKAQRALSRKQKGSRNRDKARHWLNRVHAKVRDQRQDGLHKRTTELVQKYDGLCIVAYFRRTK